MINGTVSLSEKAKVALNGDNKSLLDMLDKLIEKTTGHKATIGVANSTLIGADVSLSLFDVNNLSGTRSDAVSLVIKGAIARFFFGKALIVNPLKIGITTQGTNII